MTQFIIQPIGYVRVNNKTMFIELEEEYTPALKGLEGFSHLQVLWWFSHCDQPEMRTFTTMPAPYRTCTDTLGIFAMRSPVRPNPLALTTVEITGIDYAAGKIGLAYIDADDGTPVIDLKPYSPCLDRVNSAGVPAWCAHWPKSLEESAVFDWAAEIG